MKDMKELNIEKQKDSCFVLVSDEVIAENYRNLSEILGVDEIDDKVQNLSEKIIQKGVEMFLYLNSCENNKVKSFWKTLYGNGNIISAPCCLGFDFEYRSIKEILLTTSRSLKSDKSKDGQKIANKIVKRLSSDIKFQYLQPNNDESNFKWTRNLQNVKGMN